MNGEYMRALSIADFKEKLLSFDNSLSSINHFEEYLPLAQTRMKTLADFQTLVEDQNGVELTDKQKELAQKLVDSYEKQTNWKKDDILKVSFEVRDEMGLSTKDLYIVLTGKPQGLPLGEKIEIEGKEDTLLRLKNLL